MIVDQYGEQQHSEIDFIIAIVVLGAHQIKVKLDITDIAI
jgi:hypothetical protein